MSMVFLWVGCNMEHEDCNCCERCGEPLTEGNNSYDSEKCDTCLEYQADKMESYKGETY